MSLAFNTTAQAQYFPTFGGTTKTTPSDGGTGIAIAAAPGYSQSSIIVAAVNSGTSVFAYASTDGVSYGTPKEISGGGYCEATSHTYECASAIATFNGHPYISFRDYNNNLEVYEGVTVGVGNIYSWTQVAVINPGYGGLSTAPAMVVFNNSLFIYYGVTDVNGYKNGLSVSYSGNGSSWTTSASTLGASSISSPSPVGLSVLGSKLYITSQQDNSNKALFYWSTSDGINWAGAEDGNLYLDSGSSMVTFKGWLVAAVKQDNSQNHIYLFSSPNGSTWYAQEDSYVMQANTTPALALYNGGISLAYIDGNNNIEGAFASY